MTRTVLSTLTILTTRPAPFSEKDGVCVCVCGCFSNDYLFRHGFTPETLWFGVDVFFCTSIRERRLKMGMIAFKYRNDGGFVCQQSRSSLYGLFGFIFATKKWGLTGFHKHLYSY